MLTAKKLFFAVGKRAWRVVIVLMGFLAASGCATLPQSSTQQQHDTSQAIYIADGQVTDQEGWWEISFHRDYQHGDDVQWHLDALIAFEVFKPMIDQSQQVSLWRFHRRAGADRAGHKFSFIFYSARQDAEKLYQYVHENLLVKQLLAESYLKRVSFYDINGKARADIESTSDPGWPPELQKSWPYFIMGASQTWLMLIDELYKQQSQTEDMDLSRRVELFKTINDKLSTLWQLNGNHAFLHHLNALFGYQELYIIDRRLMRF